MLSSGTVQTYLIAMDGHDAVKIGRTNQPPLQRLAALQTGNPSRLEVVLTVDGDWEGTLHHALRESRLSGEWFWLPDPDRFQVIALILAWAEAPEPKRWPTEFTYGGWNWEWATELVDEGWNPNWLQDPAVTGF
ncbi:GIY-YIG nuclease family protein [Streptomyces sp. Isolate_45]|uniref:GIY-YIG nuclease family protein n=1 Tax=Streptomyces sp. Isolate_45 TaxID=2950111 RepID=UPI002481EA57|nr:GIY-YIG nuclease family protein [Streptomyces sp. Isolate_45]MDA5279908.1 GIY-YIG nuclease family protein [Streptomyces sp. Isolate_45]